MKIVKITIMMESKIFHIKFWIHDQRTERRVIVHYQNRYEDIWIVSWSRCQYKVVFDTHQHDHSISTRSKDWWSLRIHLFNSKDVEIRHVNGRRRDDEWSNRNKLYICITERSVYDALLTFQICQKNHVICKSSFFSQIRRITLDLTKKNYSNKISKRYLINVVSNDFHLRWEKCRRP